MNLKDIIRKTLNALHLDLTQNLKYDRLTKAVISKVVKRSSICIDVGCHKGEILDLILKYSPEGKHYGFEPIPDFYNALKNKYQGFANILPYALADHEGSTTFQYVKNAPAYSGLKKREYSVEHPEIEEIPVQITTLDKVIPADTKISFIKIDVEGAELGVLKGAKDTLERNKPVIIFECGLGASEFYNTKPEEVYRFLTQEAGLKVSLLDKWLKQDPALSQKEFCDHFNNRDEYYFIACP